MSPIHASALEIKDRLSTPAKPFTTAAWELNRHVYDAILHMPFIHELGAGTLLIERFRHYLIQRRTLPSFLRQGRVGRCVKVGR